MAPVIKKIAIFGATGNTGLATVETALKKGYEVTAFVRDASKLPESISSSVNVIVGDVLNGDDVLKAVEGQDAVIIVLGTRMNLGPTTVMSEGTQNILDAMKAAGVKRVSATMSSFLFWDPNKIPERVLNVTSDHERMLAVLKESDVEWMAMCPPHIDDSPARGDYTVKLEARVGPSISKYDLAEILLNSLADDSLLGKRVGMGYAAA